jgi:signal transduction histidine kinase
MPPMLPSLRPVVVLHGNRLLPAQRGCASLRNYSEGSSREWVRRAKAVGGPCAYARRMLTHRGQRTFYAAGWVISAGVMVVAFRVWQLHLREVEQRADEAERTRDEAAQRRAMEERLRIARELHDSLTHSISVIQVQAGVAVHLARKRGEEVPPSLLAIQEAGADAVRELRTTLSVLRTDEDGDGSGLAQLDGLVARAEGAGLPVTVTVTGTERALPSEVDQAAYRIVQEALTNVSRHAGPACASVHLHYTPRAFSVQVDDDGAGAGNSPRSAGGGLGLIGMRERVTALGGELHAGPRDCGGFQVRAEFPARAQALRRAQT